MSGFDTILYVCLILHIPGKHQEDAELKQLQEIVEFRPELLYRVMYIHIHI